MNIDIRCSSSKIDPRCLKCNIDGCMKCPVLLIIDNRHCTDSCPSGYLDQWSSNPDYMGRICVPQNINGSTHAAISGIFVGFLLCVTFLIVSVILIKRKKRRKTIKEILISENNIDRSDFLRQLDDIRPNSEYILAMLNDTRRQIRKLHLSGETSAANSYRPLIRDLAKLLILLNRPIELIPAPPHDWYRIYTWAERALEQYKPQYGQLIDFFQNDSYSNNDQRFDTSLTNNCNKNLHYHHTTTFRSSPHGITTTTSSPTNFIPGGATRGNSHQMQLFGSLISLHEFDEPKSSDPFGSSNNFHNNTTPSSTTTTTTNLYKGTGSGTTNTGNNMIMMTNSDLNASSLWLEDEFFKLGLRPQDEITTEL